MTLDIYGRDADYPYNTPPTPIDLHDDSERKGNRPYRVGIDPKSIKCEECSARPWHRCEHEGKHVDWVHQAREDNARESPQPPTPKSIRP